MSADEETAKVRMSRIPENPARAARRRLISSRVVNAGRRNVPSLKVIANR